MLWLFDWDVGAEGCCFKLNHISRWWSAVWRVFVRPLSCMAVRPDIEHSERALPSSTSILSSTASLAMVIELSMVELVE